MIILSRLLIRKKLMVDRYTLDLSSYIFSFVFTLYYICEEQSREEKGDKEEEKGAKEIIAI